MIYFYGPAVMINLHLYLCCLTRLPPGSDSFVTIFNTRNLFIHYYSHK